LLRGDGTSLYATNDLILTQYKFDKFNLDQSIWVVCNEQDLYFKQLFKIFEKLGRPWAKKCFHLSYGYVSLTTGKMKSREGTVVDVDDLIKEIKELALTEVSNRYTTLKPIEIEERAKKIALASIKFYLLKNDAKKDMIYDAKASISFDGETGPYVQYTFARSKSILRKAKKENISYIHNKFDLLKEQKEIELISELAEFTNSVEKSKDILSLHPLCHNLIAIAQKFNSMYQEIQILKTENKDLLNARLSLVEATCIVLKKGLEILDIEAIEEM
jgi:arginyl-tRNA synthetase